MVDSLVRPVVLPGPGVDDDARLGFGVVHTVLDGAIDFRHNLLDRPAGAAGAPARSAATFRMAVGGVFRHRDGKDAGEFRHLPKQLGGGTPHVFQHGRLNRAQAVQLL